MKPLNQLLRGDKITRRITYYRNKIEIEPAWIDPDSDGEDWCDERCEILFNSISGIDGMTEYEEWEFEVVNLKRVHSKETIDGLTCDNRKIFSVEVRPIKRNESVRYQRIYTEENFFHKEIVSGTRVVSTEKIPVTFEDKKYRCDGELLVVRTVSYEGKIINIFILKSQSEKKFLDDLRQSLPKGIPANSRFLNAYVLVAKDELEKILLY